ncbi:MAG: hypothetical protein WD032_06575 [Nitrospirales bacterium]
MRRCRFDSKAVVSDDILEKLIGDSGVMSVQNRLVCWTTIMGGLVATLMLFLPAVPVQASPGSDVFQSFTQHISAQIGKDKQAFAEADTCTAWFYKQMGKKPPAAAKAEKIHFVPISQSEASVDCATRYPTGLVGAREDFGLTQQRLSFSLTFFQMALISDGDDDHAYNTQEMHDVLEAFGRTYRNGQSVDQYVSQLVGLFDRNRPEVEFPVLMASMQTLMDKGYRLTEADQTALNRELK